ncbi:hypothetical protein BDP55DRAFT_747417 [Colletotrichum godetiae]|uniref:Uncharacterized protein n=1 Tax=Colletotrichum godetiae TaxID=1209918 RepID=A0AAJ0ETX6_9PEZI|nr:uncharacterized protein BDP55DRAFT_747417 [Colletotrichum godetiae]KAK1673763.1 hypothetical protein BDP55DRAFT_747417 [Colletotrichum godetiae]
MVELPDEIGQQDAASSPRAMGAGWAKKEHERDPADQGQGYLVYNPAMPASNYNSPRPRVHLTRRAHSRRLITQQGHSSQNLAGLDEVQVIDYTCTVLHGPLRMLPRTRVNHARRPSMEHQIDMSIGRGVSSISNAAPNSLLLRYSTTEPAPHRVDSVKHQKSDVPYHSLHSTNSHLRLFITDVRSPMRVRRVNATMGRTTSHLIPPQ